MTKHDNAHLMAGVGVRILVIGAALLLTSSVAWAQTVRGIQIVEYGIYTADKGSCQRDAQGIQRCNRTNVRHAATTTDVPAEIGVEFGLRYRVLGTPDGSKVSIKRVWLIPAPGFQAPGATQPLRRLERVDNTAIGETNFVSYGFDDTWELVLGPWILEFWYGDVKVGEQRFTVVRP